MIMCKALIEKAEYAQRSGTPYAMDALKAELRHIFALYRPSPKPDSSYDFLDDPKLEVRPYPLDAAPGDDGPTTTHFDRAMNDVTDLDGFFNAAGSLIYDAFSEEFNLSDQLNTNIKDRFCNPTSKAETPFAGVTSAFTLWLRDSHAAGQDNFRLAEAAFAPAYEGALGAGRRQMPEQAAPPTPGA